MANFSLTQCAHVNSAAGRPLDLIVRGLVNSGTSVVRREFIHQSSDDSFVLHCVLRHFMQQSPSTPMPFELLK